MNKKAYVTTSIAYTNSDPHIGFALELVQSDTLVRFYRKQNYEVYFLTGTDENAIKNVEAAEKKALSPQEFVDKVAQSFYNLKEAYNISFDQFIRTTSKLHLEGAQKLWELCKKDIYKKTYEGLYCTGCETFYKDKEFPDNICPLHHRKLELVQEENYFFALSKYESQVRKILEESLLHIFPAYRKDEILNFIKKGLEDFSISRPRERTKNWGIPVPHDETQMMYVWFDALSNYISALDFAHDGKLYQKFWLENPNRIHVIGKDIIKFHAIYWLAMLLSAHIPLPTTEFVHGFINVEGKKMSKSLGNVIDPFELVQKYGTDAVRYYLLREIPSLGDGDFSYSRMDEIYNADLANELGNLILRITTLAEKDEIKVNNRSPYILPSAQVHLFETFQFNILLEAIWKEIKDLNKAIDDFSPWKKTAEERASFLGDALKKIHVVGQRLEPFMPETAEKIINATDGTIHKIEPLFPKK